MVGVSNPSASWNGNSDNWTTAADWSDGAIPDPTTAVTISAGDPQITSNVGTISSLTVSSALSILGGGVLNVTGATLLSGGGVIDLRNGGRLTTSAGLTVSGGNGRLKVDSYGGPGGSQVTIGGNLVNASSGVYSDGGVSVGNNSMGQADALTVQGTLTNTGGLVTVTGGNVAGATAKLTVTGAAAATLTGTFNIVGNAGGAILQYGSGAVTQIGDGASNGGWLALDGANAFAEVGASNSNSLLATLATLANNGGLDLRDGASVTTTTGLAVSGGNARLKIDAYGGSGGSQVTIGGNLINTSWGWYNDGGVSVGNNSMSHADSLTVKGTLTNTGALVTLAGGNVAGATAQLTVTGAAAATLTGQYNIVANAGGAVLQYGSGAVTQIGDGASNSGWLTLDGANAYAEVGASNSNSLLNTLATLANNGGLDLRNGAGVTTTTGLTVNGGTARLKIDSYGGSGGSQATIGGNLVNTSLGYYSDGGVSVGNNSMSHADTLTVKGTLTNTGALVTLAGGNAIGATAQLTVTGAAAATLTGTYNLVANAGGAALQYGSGAVTQIGDGASNGGWLSLDGANAYAEVGATNSNSLLATLATLANNGGLDLRNGAGVTTTTGLTVNGGTARLKIDSYGGSGGSQVTVGGNLVNTSIGYYSDGGVSLGNSSMTHADTLTVKGTLTNTGALVTLTGGNAIGATAQATVTGAAASKLTGTYNIVGNAGGAVLQYGSGAVTQLGDGAGNGAWLLLDGANAFAEVGATSSNSLFNALSSIDANSGLDLRDGASVTTTTGLTLNGGSARLKIDAYGGSGGSQVIVGGNLVNSSFGSYNDGGVSVGNSGMSHADSLTVKGTLTNTAALVTLTGGATGATAQLSVTGAAAAKLTGTYSIVGNAGGAVLQYGSGGVTQLGDGAGNGGWLTIDGANAFAEVGATNSNSLFNALSGIDANSGLDLRDGASITTTTGLTLNGGAARLKVDAYGGVGGSQVTIGGNLVNSSFGSYNDGGVSVGGSNVSQADSLTVKGNVVNSGAITLNSGAGRASLTATGAVVNSGALNAYFDSLISAGSYTQTNGGELTLELQGTDAAHHAAVAATGGVTLNGGTLNTPANTLTFAAGQTFNLFTFASGQLNGIFSALGAQADGTTFNLGNGLLLGIEYQNSAGLIQEKIVAAPASTADNWTAGSGDWGTAASWSNGAPDFYSAVTISTAANAAVTLSADATIDSLNIGAKDALTTGSGTDLSIGAGLTVAGALTVNGKSFIDGAAVNTGTIAVGPGGALLDIRGAITGAGGFTLGAGSTLEFGSSDAETVTFAGANATLKLDNPSAFTGTLANLAVGDAIDLAGLTVVSPTVTGGNTLSFKDSNNIAYSYALTGFPGGAGFAAQSDGNGGTLLVVTPPTTTVTVNAVEGNNIINKAQAQAGVPLGGSIAGLASGATFSVKVVDGAFSKTYTATVNADGKTWSATIPAADAITLPDGSASVTAIASASAQASQSVVVHQTLPTLAISPVDGNNIINAANAAAGVTIAGTSTGLASGATFGVTLTDGTFSKAYTATVGPGGAWTTTVPAADAKTLADGTATLTTSQPIDAYGNPAKAATGGVTVHETLPTLTISPVDGNNIINAANAAAGVTIAGTSTGLASGATFSVTVTDNGVVTNYSATVGSGGAWSATIPPANAKALANGNAQISAQAFDGFGNPSNIAADTVAVQGLLPTLTISPVDGNNVINAANAAAGVTIAGTSSGLASGATFTVTLTDGTFSKAYTATVGAGGAWTATVPAADAKTLADGTATLTTSQPTDAYGNPAKAATDSVTVHETLPTLTISPVDGNNIINAANAAAGVTIAGTSTGLASGSTFTVTLTDGTFSKAYTATVGAGGAWTASVPAADAKTLADGTATLTTSQPTDAYGNPAKAATGSVTVDETLPTLTISPVDGNNIINAANAAAGVTIAGTSTGLASGATFTVTLTDGTFSKAYTATVGAGGAWTATVPAADAKTLADGTATLTTSQPTDAYGNPAKAATDSVTVRETLPTLTISPVDGNNIINAANAAAGVTIAGTSTGLASGATFTVTLTDGTFSKVYTATVGAGGAWTASVPAADAKTLADGTATLTTSQPTDAYGNPAKAATDSVTVAQAHGQPPTVSAQETLFGLTNLTSDTITETATAAAGLTIAGVEVFDGKTDLGAATFGAGVWSFTAQNLSDGAHHFTTVTTDSAGNATTSALAELDVATQPPKVTASESVSGPTNKTSVTITGTATAEAVPGDSILLVEVLNGATPLGPATLNAATGAWSYTASGLADGVYTFDTVTTDAAGNFTITTLAEVDVATKAPTVTASESVSGLTNKTIDTITATATAEAVGANAIKSVVVYDGGKALGTATLASGKWTYTTGVLADGAHLLKTVTTDLAGNVTTTALAEVDVATKAPTVTATQSLSGLTNKTIDTITATATAEAVGANAVKSVVVYDGSKALGPATFASGKWTYTTGVLADGAHLLKTVTTDTVGNVTTTALAEVDVATKAPTVTASESASGLTQNRSNTITETAVAEAVGANAIKSVEVFDLFNGVKTDLGAASLAQGVWTFTASNLAFGVHTFSTVTTDAAGNATTTTLAADNVEPPPPKVSIALQKDSSNGKAITNTDALTGGGDANATVSFTIDGVAATLTAAADATGAWSFTPAGLSQGAHTIVASETNGGGTGKASIAFTYDTIAPAVRIATPSGAVANATQTINGAGEAGTLVQLYDGTTKLGATVTVGANGLWRETVTLSGTGAHAITARDTDVAANVGVSAVTTLTLDNQIIGKAGQFVLTGTSGNDHIVVGAGNIVVSTLGGDDTVTLTNAAGQFHLIVGGGGSDTLDLSQTTGGATVNLAQNKATGAQIGTNFVFNFANIIGGGGDETLIGGQGGGLIQAGSGNDALTGGGGANTFAFLSPFGKDVITNFQASGRNHGVVVFDQSLFANWSLVDAALTDTGAGAQIALNANETLTFTGVTKATLEANASADFRFV
ncbi:hypothetical protein M2323_003758 [Rhodoblastus acidophilus]|uniref:beta strand repeat-containing protein n=1 Tax=Rhodoblastus acidophilus TaxID=1074 RepID=UPI002224F16C|nr:Ig-like domain-containing protein [Rhodoblastus acidophilus]MCW2285883.1 hypothetical protein [Rhodoblastus acidophilus]MCW2334816.1 hypothetical protein [Rhodoblastus acidophilus]